MSLLEALEDIPFPRLPQRLKTACVPWLTASSSVSNASSTASPDLAFSLSSLFIKPAHDEKLRVIFDYKLELSDCF